MCHTGTARYFPTEKNHLSPWLCPSLSNASLDTATRAICTAKLITLPFPGLNEPMNSLYLWVSREWEVLHDVSQDYCLSITSLCLRPNDEHFPQCTPFLSTQHNFWDSAEVTIAWNLFLWHLSSPQGWNRCPSSEDPLVLQHYHTLTWASLPISFNKPWLLQRQIASSMCLIKAVGTPGHCPAWGWRSEHN